MNRLKSNRFLSVQGGGLLKTGAAAAAGSPPHPPTASTSTSTLDHKPPASSAAFVDLTGSDDEDPSQFEEVAPNPFKRRKVAADPVESAPSPAKAKARARAKPKAKAKGKEKEHALQSTVDWPVHFKKLEQVFKVRGGRLRSRRVGECRSAS